MTHHPTTMDQRPQFSVGGMGMSGERCVHQLLSRIMMLKIRQAGGECDESDILKIISDVDVWRGGWGRGRDRGVSKGGVTFTVGEADGNGVRPIAALVGTEWSVYLLLEPSGEGGVVTSLLKDPDGGQRSFVHDLPDSSAGKTTVSTGEDYTGGEHGTPMAYVSRETHYAHGLLWDPSAEIAADICYYEDGGVKWKRRYQGGRMMGRGDFSPAHESYWPGNSLQAAEYGSVNFGRHRDPAAGPAYIEYHPNGQKALEVFAHRGPDGRIGVTGGGAWDSQGRPRVPGAEEVQTLSETDLMMAMGSAELDAFFCARRKDREVAEAVAETAPERADDQWGTARGISLSHPSGMRQTLGKAGSGVAKGRGGR